MIALLGFKRVAILAALVGLNLLIGSAAYLYLIPEFKRKETENRGLQGQISTLRSDIDRMQVEYEQLQSQQEFFTELKTNGFFDRQGRRAAQTALENIQQEAGVNSAVTSIEALSVIEDPEAAKADHKILSSPMNINIDAVDAVDVFRYVGFLVQKFPGHVEIAHFRMERKADINGTVLRAIASGENPKLVEAEIKTIWRTMVPADDPIVKSVNESGGAP